MLHHRELATLRAALLFWHEEICPHGTDVMRLYFDRPDVEPLSAEDVQRLRSRLLPVHVHYALLVPESMQLAETTLYETVDAALTASPDGTVPVSVHLTL